MIIKDTDYYLCVEREDGYYDLLPVEVGVHKIHADDQNNLQVLNRDGMASRCWHNHIWIEWEVLEGADVRTRFPDLVDNADAEPAPTTRSEDLATQGYR